MDGNIPFDERSPASADAAAGRVAYPSTTPRGETAVHEEASPAGEDAFSVIGLPEGLSDVENDPVLNPSIHGSAHAVVQDLVVVVGPIVNARIPLDRGRNMPRNELVDQIGEIVDDIHQRGRIEIPQDYRRDLITALVNTIRGDIDAEARSAPESRASWALSDGRGRADANGGDPSDSPFSLSDLMTRPQQRGARRDEARLETIENAKRQIQPVLMDRIDVSKAGDLPRAELARQIGTIVSEIVAEQRMRLNLSEQRDLLTTLINDMLGLGPLEPLLADEAITDIMVNGPKQIYVERKGKLDLTDVTFKDNRHVMNIASRIVTRIGRRIDETSPICDARLADGSRVNIIIPPLAIDGPSISIRKFSKKSITLDIMAKQKNLSLSMSTVLKIASRSRLNILISGGTGSGKTTLLNALSRIIDPGERVVTIEDAAELQLQQPHVVRLETRPPNLEGEGEINMRDLVKNSLRMRPDRIILGEIRGAEAVDMLQAMNTGHEGSMCTIHANKPREALTRLENMVGMAGINLPSKAVRTQIASAVDLIVQVSRMRDGMRRITSITEVVGMEGDVITTQELFHYEYEGEEPNGLLRGNFVCSGLRPHFTAKAEYFNLDRPLIEAIG